jgi:hypothetical protein
MLQDKTTGILNLIIIIEKKQKGFGSGAFFNEKWKDNCINEKYKLGNPLCLNMTHQEYLLNWR